MCVVSRDYLTFNIKEYNMKKEDFKTRWESSDSGGGITNDDIADHAIEWGLCSYPRTMQIDHVLYMVLEHAKTNDSEEFKPNSRN